MRLLPGQLYTHLKEDFQTEVRLYIWKISDDEVQGVEIYYRYGWDNHWTAGTSTQSYDIFLSYLINKGYSLYDIGDTTWISYMQIE